jgi:uncharacterized protein YfaS (alpha-2-macroglobulin family)
MTVAMLERRDLGDQRRVTVTFVDETGTPINPTTVTARVRRPDGVIVTITGGSITNPSPGVYRVLLPIFDLASIWRWRIAGTGNVNEAIEGVVLVAPSKFPIET